MLQPKYFSKFTLKDYIAGLVRKDSEPSSTKDYLHALDSYEEKPKYSSSSLSAEARPFLPLKTVYILVSSKKSDISFTIPVFSYTLSITTLRQYFPLATSMYFIENGQMITLATSKNHNIVVNTVTELSELNFCIPDSSHRYFVSEHDEVAWHGLYETAMEGAVKCVEGIKDKLTSTMAEVKKLEEEVKELLKLLRENADETFVNMNNNVNTPNNQCVYDINQNYIESADTFGDGDYVQLVHTSSEHSAGMGCSLSLKESAFKNVSTEVSYTVKDLGVKDEVVSSDELVVEEKKYVDDYGFSDTDIDENIDVVTVKDVDCKEVKEDNRYGIEVEKSSRNSSPVDAVSVPRFKSESCSLSSRPRCVRRVVGK